MSSKVPKSKPGNIDKGLSNLDKPSPFNTKTLIPTASTEKVVHHPVQEYSRKALTINLERWIKEAVRKVFEEASNYAKMKNEGGKTTDQDLKEADNAFIRLGEIRNGIRETIAKLNLNRNIVVAKKQEISTTLEKFVATYNDIIDKKKQLPVKVNAHLLNMINDTNETLKRLNQYLGSFKGGCCASKPPPRLDPTNHLKELQFFWQGLSIMDAREGYMEIYHAPKYNEKEFVEELRQLLESNLPEQLHVSSKVVEKVVSDRVREAHELLFGFGRPQHVQDALKIYNDEYKQNNNIYAINALAQIYLEGEFVQEDFKKASDLYQISAQNDDPEGWYRLGQMLEEDLTTPNQLQFVKEMSRKADGEEMALFCIDRAASYNHLDALTDLGYIFENGKTSKSGKALIQPDIDKAVEQYTIAKKARFPRAMNNLGNLYLNDKVRERNKGDNANKAIECLTLAKEQGNAKAIFNLGVCYERGKGVRQDLDLAKTHFKDAGKRGDIDGKLFYAFYVLQDAAFSQSEAQYIEAGKFLNEIVAQDPSKKEALYYLGFLYENGLGVQKDHNIALSYYDKAASLNHIQSLVKVGDFYYVGAGDLEQDMGEAVQFYQIAAKQGSIEALLNLGAIYEEGYDGNKNFQKAFECYNEAAKQGNDPRAYLNLASMYEKGKYVNQSEEEAVKYYRKAVELGDPIAKDILKSKGYSVVADQFEKNLILTGEGLSNNLTKSFHYSSNEKKVPMLSSVYVSSYLKKNQM